MPPALIILDAQNDFFAVDNPNLSGFEQTVPVINRAAAAFRQRGWPVIFAQHTSSSKPQGSTAWQINAGFVRTPGDLSLIKTRHNAFDGSSLQQALAARSADVLVIAGYVAELCVLATYRAAARMHYQVFLLQGGVAGMDGTRIEDAEPDALWMAVETVERSHRKED